MLNVTPAFQAKIDSHSRSSRALIILDLLPDEIVVPTAVASSEKIGYPVSNILKSRISLDETNGIGEYLPEYLKEKFDGWRSEIISDEAGIFADPINIEITYGLPVLSSNFWIVGTKEEYITDFNFSIYDNSDTLVFEEEVVDNDKSIWNPIIPIKLECKRIVITVKGNNIKQKEALLLNAGIIDTLVLTDNEITDYELLEELTSDESLPFGGVSSNEFSFNINNPMFLFTPANSKGPLAGLLVPGAIINAYFGLEGVSNTFEYVPLGKYTISEWRAPSQGVDASVVGYDRLFDLSEEPVPMLRLEENTTVAELFIRLFIALGIPADEFEIDSNIISKIPYGFVPQGEVSDALKILSQAGMCRVSVNRLNKIIVKSFSPQKISNVDWTDNEQIVNIENPEKFNSLYGKVSVSINVPSLRRTNDLASVNDLEIPSGTSIFERAEFSKSPVLIIDDVALLNTKGSVLGEISYGTHHINIEIINSTASPEINSLLVKGVYCSFVKREFIEEANPKNKKQLNVNNELIQTDAHAILIASSIIPYISDPFPFFELEIRGNPSLELGDIVKLNVSAANIEDVYIEIYRSTLRYSGAIEGSIVGRRVI
jgi:hypothetical protein